MVVEAKEKVHPEASALQRQGTSFGFSSKALFGVTPVRRSRSARGFHCCFCVAHARGIKVTGAIEAYKSIQGRKELEQVEWNGMGTLWRVQPLEGLAGFWCSVLGDLQVEWMTSIIQCTPGLCSRMGWDGMG